MNGKMRFIQQRCLFIVVVLTAFFSSPVLARPVQEDEAGTRLTSSPDDEKAVRKLADEFITAFRLSSSVPTAIARLEEIFADDICQITMGGEVIRGKKNNLLFYRDAWQKRQADLRVFTKRYDIQSVKISCDLAVVFGRVEGEGRRKDAIEPFGIDFMETLVFQKIDGGA